MTDFSALSYKPCISVVTDILASGAMDAVIIQGPPGTGKTALTKYVHQNLGNAHYYMVKPGHHEPYDFHGLPVPEHTTKTTNFYPSGDLLPASDLKGGCTMVWDEALDASTAIQNLLCQAIFENKFHCYTFPENTKHILTGNSIIHKSGAQRIITKMANRAAMVTLCPTVDELFDHAGKNGWSPSVMAFLKVRGNDIINPNQRRESDFVPTYFNSFDPQDPTQSLNPIFASSRTWEATSKLIQYIDKVNSSMPDYDLLPRVASLIGSAAATAYVPFRSEAMTMPDPDAIARGDPVPYPDKLSIMWTLVISLVSRSTAQNVKTIYNWINKGGNKEFSILYITQCFFSRAKYVISPEFNELLLLPEIMEVVKHADA